MAAGKEREAERAGKKAPEGWGAWVGRREGGGDLNWDGLGHSVSQEGLRKLGKEFISHLLETKMSLCFRYFFRSSGLTTGDRRQAGELSGLDPGSRSPVQVVLTAVSAY